MKILRIIALMLASMILFCGCSDEAKSRKSSEIPETSEEITEEETESETEPETEEITEVSDDEKHYYMDGFSFDIGTALRRYNGAHADLFDYTFRLINDVYQSSMVGVAVTEEIRVSASMYGELFLSAFGEEFTDTEKSEYEVNGFDAYEISGTSAENPIAKMRFVTISSSKGTLLSFMAIYLDKYDEQYAEALQAILSTVTYDESAVQETDEFICPEFRIKAKGKWSISYGDDKSVYFGYTKADNSDEMNSLVSIEADSSSSRLSAEQAARYCYDIYSIFDGGTPGHEESVIYGYNVYHITYRDSEGHCYENYFFETNQVLYEVNIVLPESIFDELIGGVTELLEGLEITNPDLL